MLEVNFFQHPIVKVKNVQRSYEELHPGKWRHHVFVYQLYSGTQIYRAFCAGSIITDSRVLSSTHCFLTNGKRNRRKLSNVRVVAGILYTFAYESTSDDIQQWRTIKKIYSQRYFRFPAFNLAVLEMNVPWTFNNYVNKIPYTHWDQDFDGVCIGTAVRAAASWSKNKTLVIMNMKLVNRKNCGNILIRSCMYYYCTEHDLHDAVPTILTEGGGLVCHGTGDPAEGENGVLVGVTSLISTKLPTFHNRVGFFHKWVTDSCGKTSGRVWIKLFSVICFCCIINV